MAFTVGDRVRTRSTGALHTRLPGYLEGRCGAIERVVGTFPFADECALGNRDVKQALYTVRFDDDDTSISADLFESYLEDDV
jgi:nitrile hydratase subunit beta